MSLADDDVLSFQKQFDHSSLSVHANADGYVLSSLWVEPLYNQQFKHHFWHLEIPFPLILVDSQYLPLHIAKRHITKQPQGPIQSQYNGEFGIQI